MYNYVIIGSAATDIFDRDSVDTDIICTYEAAVADSKALNKKTIAFYPLSGNKIVHKYLNSDNKYCITEYEIAYPKSNAEKFLNYVLTNSTESDLMLSYIYKKYYKTQLEVLYALKMSHRFKKNSPHFLKTMKDIHTLRKHITLPINPELTTLMLEREKETLDYGHPKLNQSKSDFFSGDGVNYVYDHDSIHRAMAVNKVPAYTNYVIGDVQVSKKLWDKCSYSTKLLGVLEETLVLALERSQIPNDFIPNPLDSFLVALEKVCTSITSGWFREFAWENYYQVVELYPANYVTIFKRSLTNGLILPYN